MSPTACLRLGAALAGLAVALGAFAAHGLKDHLEPTALETFQTGVRYQTWHALAIVLCAALGDRRRTGPAAVSFAVGILLFSGSLYGLALAELRWLGPVTPFGGLAFLVGWLLLAFAKAAR